MVERIDIGNLVWFCKKERREIWEGIREDFFNFLFVLLLLFIIIVVFLFFYYYYVFYFIWVFDELIILNRRWFNFLFVRR